MAEDDEWLGLLRQRLAILVQSWTTGAFDADDVVQETIARLIPRLDSLDPDVAIAYAVVIAKNIIRSQARREARASRLNHKMAESSVDNHVSDELDAREERDALKRALAQFKRSDAELLVAHHVREEDLVALAQAHQTSEGALAVRLARIRSQLRVEYLIAYRHAVPPTTRCRPVLVSLSAGDKRRQLRLGAADHLVECAMCADLAPALLERSRGLVVVLPFALLGQSRRALRHLMQHPGQGVVVGGAAACAAVVAMQIHQSPSPRPAVLPVTTTTLTSACTNVLTVAGKSPESGTTALPASDGDAVVANNATVYSTEEAGGFWVGCSGYGLWVQVTGSLTQNPVVGTKASFTGRVQHQSSRYAESIGLPKASDSSLLDDEAYHVDVSASAIVLDSGPAKS
jgi:RNA polymerase sigma factor (sigma-70 family)